MTGKAIDWAAAVWEANSLFQRSYAYFVQQLRDVFEYPAGGKDVSTQLLQLTQGRRSATDYAIGFRTLAAQSGWIDVSLKAVFQQSLNVGLQAELACKEGSQSFSEYVTLAIKIDNLMRNNPTRSKSPSQRIIPINQASQISNPIIPTVQSSPEPMQLGVTKLSKEERLQRLIQSLFFYCGEAGPINAICPLKAQRTTKNTSRVSNDSLSPLTTKSLTISVKITTEDDSIDFTVLIESGSALNLMHQDLIKKFNIPMQPCDPPLKVNAIDNKPIGDGIIQQTLPMQLQI